MNTAQECNELYWTNPGINTPAKQQLYGHLLPISKPIQVRRTRHAGHYWRSKDEIISFVFQWTSTYDHASVDRPARTNLLQLCADTGYSQEDPPVSMHDRDRWSERVRKIRASRVMIYSYISFDRYLILLMLICDHWFHAVFTRQSSGFFCQMIAV